MDFKIPSLETVCMDGHWLGMSNCNNFDLFDYNERVYRVNRDTGNVTPIPDSLVEHFLGEKYVSKN